MTIGGIGSITSSNSMSVKQVSSSDLKDQKSKSLQNDITDVQRQIQKLSSEEDLTAAEKAEEKKKLQQEESDLSTKLKLHQDELLKSQKREIKLAELQEERKPEQEKDSESKVQAPETSSASNTADEKKLPADDRRNLQPGTVITQNSDGTVILKEILNQSTERDADANDQRTETIKEETAADEREKQAAEDEEAADTSLSENEVQTIVSANTTMQQADRQGALVTETSDDIAVLKGEIKQDAYRGTDTERKQEELREMQKQQKREMAFQFSMLGEANRTALSVADQDASVRSNAERTFRVSGVNASQEDIALQQGFQVSIA